MKILLVTGVSSSVTLAEGLGSEGFTVVAAADGHDALWLGSEERFDVIVLDVSPPSFGRFELLRELRERNVWTPVLVLNTGDDRDDETDAFDLGADDYLKRPYRFRVLVARLRALGRRGTPQRAEALRAGTLVLDPASRVVLRDGVNIALTPREFSVLEHLMRFKDTVVTKTEIVQNVWDRNYRGPENIVEVYVRNLRRKIDLPFGTNTIETARGVGYRLIP